MKNLPSLTKLVAVVACALSLAACNRAEYVMLPQTATYYGQHTVRVTPTTPTVATTALQTADAPTAATVATVVLAPAPLTPTRHIKAVVAQQQATNSQSVTTSVPAASEEVAVRAPKATLSQRLALATLTHKLDKALQKSSTVRSHDNTASVTKGGISGNLRTGIILLLVGLLVGIFSHLIGTIIALIGVIFIVLWLLDSL